ncbi:MAG: methyltransferase domain-containing protein [Solirubrobacterales bacterium]|nr:methyltransferase domain-containing protein [Solirubrobacterales bacterium]
MASEDRWLAAQWPKIRPCLPAPPAYVVEVGCGSLGGFVPALDSCGYQALGIDPAAPDGDSYCRQKVECAELRAQANAVVACTSLHHVAELGEALDKIVQLLVPGGVVIVVEWDWERFDEATAQWCFERLGESEGWLHHRRQEWITSAQPWQRYLETWANEHRIHTGGAVLGELDQRLRRQLCRRGAYFFADLANTTEADELHAIDSGAIQATRIDYVGTLP